MPASPEAHEHVDRLFKHLQQVDAGLIPADSPPDFVRPEGDEALVDGKPWWFGPDYHPTPEALASFSGQPPAESATDD